MKVQNQIYTNHHAQFNTIQSCSTLHLFVRVPDDRDPTVKKAHKILEGVKVGKTFAKWGNLDENLLNGVINVKNLKIGGKN
jgi:hypothetical protein